MTLNHRSGVEKKDLWVQFLVPLCLGLESSVLVLSCLRISGVSGRRNKALGGRSKGRDSTRDDCCVIVFSGVQTVAGVRPPGPLVPDRKRVRTPVCPSHRHLPTVRVSPTTERHETRYRLSRHSLNHVESISKVGRSWLSSYKYREFTCELRSDTPLVLLSPALCSVRNFSVREPSLLVRVCWFDG